MGLPDPYPNEPNEDTYMMGGILLNKKNQTATKTISSLNVADIDTGHEYPMNRYIEGFSPMTLYYPSP